MVVKSFKKKRQKKLLEENEQTSNIYAMTHVCSLERQTRARPGHKKVKQHRPYGSTAAGTQICRGHGDSRPTPGFLLHGFKASQGAKPTAYGRQQTQGEQKSTTCQQTCNKRYRWTSKSSINNNWQRSGKCDEENKLPRFIEIGKENNSTPTGHRVQETTHAEAEILNNNYSEAPMVHRIIPKCPDQTVEGIRRVMK